MTVLTTPTSSSVVAVRARTGYLDNLKVLMVMAVIVAHALFAWTDLGVWVLKEGPLREPWLTVASLAGVIGGLFGLALFFVIAGMLTPRSLRRKGTRRFLADRTLRLLVPMVGFVLLMSPLIEYVDSDNAGWSRGFWAFVPEVLWPPAPGPTWFLGVLLLFSVSYALIRRVVPERPRPPTPMTATHLAVAVAAVAVPSYVVRIAAHFGEEQFRLALGQSPAWIVAFTLGVVAGERGWFDPVPPALARTARRIALTGLGLAVAVFAAIAVTEADVDAFAGGGTWQSALLTVPEALLVVGASIWLLDVFRRRYDRQGPLARELGRGAFAAFLLHQGILVLVILGTHHLPWPTEVEFLTAAGLAVVLSFAVASAFVRLPGVRRIV